MPPFSNGAEMSFRHKMADTGPGLTEWGPMSGDSALCDEEVHEALSDELGRLSGSATFTVAEFAVGTASIFEISRDQHGTPTAIRWTYAYTGGALRVEEEDRWSQALADPERFYRCVAPKFIVRAPQRLPTGLSDLLSRPRPEVPVYPCHASLPELLRAAVRESPLVLGYELAVLRRVPAGRTGAARVVLTGLPLFSPGETQGCQVTIRVNCEPTDAEGTAFAVVTREPRPDLPRQAQQMRPLQIQAALVPPGSYAVTAVLARPGQVRFQGLPAALGPSVRSWEELGRLVPGQLAAPAPVHLVCLIEVCGGDDRLKQRIYRLEELITKAQTGARPLRVSVVAYGAHGVAWKVEDRPPEIRAWAAPGPKAVNALRGLVSRPADEREYQRAAQLECVLKLVRERLAATDGRRAAATDARPVIVTAGGRPAHPPGLDTSTLIIPCPDWVDGAWELGRLLSLPGITLGALRDPKCRGGLWDQLGQHAVATVDDAVDMESFAAGLGLLAAAQTVPFPVAEQ
jgi:hypothetical protein